MLFRAAKLIPQLFSKLLELASIEIDGKAGQLSIDSREASPRRAAAELHRGLRIQPLLAFAQREIGKQPRSYRA